MGRRVSTLVVGIEFGSATPVSQTRISLLHKRRGLTRGLRAAFRRLPSLASAQSTPDGAPISLVAALRVTLMSGAGVSLCNLATPRHRLSDTRKRVIVNGPSKIASCLAPPRYTSSLEPTKTPAPFQASARPHAEGPRPAVPLRPSTATFLYRLSLHYHPRGIRSGARQHR